ncbi:hypothetical protein D3C78_1454150 [compost metagenome]
MGNPGRHREIVGRGHDQGDGRQGQQGGLGACSENVVVLLRKSKPAGQHRSPLHQQDVADDGADDGRLHHVMQAGLQGGKGDDQFGGIAEGGVEQAADALATALGQLLGGAPQPAGQGNDGQCGHQKQQEVPLRGEELQGNGDGHEDQHPTEHGCTPAVPCPGRDAGIPASMVGHWRPVQGAMGPH